MGLGISLGTIGLGSTKRLRVTITKDGPPWDLSAGTVTLLFERPGRQSSFTRPMLPQTTGMDGVFIYDVQPSDLDVGGYWNLGLTAVAGGLTEVYAGEISLIVIAP